MSTFTARAENESPQEMNGLFKNADAYDCAEAFAEDYWNAYCESPRDLDVWVSTDGGPEVHFVVEPEYTVNYHAREVLTPAPKPGGGA